jgi:hypothetical protein
MNKKFKKSDLENRISKLKDDYVVSEEELNELIDTDGSLIDPRDNFKATDKVVKSKSTSDEFARSTAQGPGAYYPYGGAYYGGYYTMSEDEEQSEESQYVDDAWDIPESELKEEIDEIAKTRMTNLVDEIMYKKKSDRDFVKRRKDEADLMHDIEIEPLENLKTVYEKPLVVRKLNHLIQLIEKEALSGSELSIIIKHLFDNIDLEKINGEERELLGDILKYGEQGEE